MRVPILALALVAAPLPAQPVPQPATGSLVGPALFVSDKAVSVRFYEALGLKTAIEIGPPTRRETILTFGGDPRNAGMILLSDSTAKAPPAIAHGHGYDRTILRVADLGAVSDRLRTAGFLPAAIGNVVMGHRVMTIADPDGYTLELVDSGGH